MQTKKNTFKRWGFLIFLSLMLTTAFAYAGDFSNKWYKIEMIVFSHLSTQAIDSEQWPTVKPPNFDHANVIQLLNKNQNDNVSSQYRLLPPNQFTLNNEEKRIGEQPNYHVLLHLAWQQKIQAPKEAKAIHIFNNNYFTSSNTNNNDRNQEALNGTITISVKKYFDVHLNLYLALLNHQLSQLSKKEYFKNNGSKFSYFRLLQTRRMRSNELNYINHPLYGVLIKITHMDDQDLEQSPTQK